MKGLSRIGIVAGVWLFLFCGSSFAGAPDGSVSPEEGFLWELRNQEGEVYRLEGIPVQPDGPGHLLSFKTDIPGIILDGTTGKQEGQGLPSPAARPGEGRDPFQEEEVQESISDPLEPVNRVFFEFNDLFYFYLLKPVAQGYEAVVPETARLGVRNFFTNLGFPVRFVNCLLQGKFESASMEFARFILNSTVGLAGLIDVASEGAQMKRYDEDFGQTLGSYGIGTGFYIHWPLLGPSSLRDTFGRAGDSFLTPASYASETQYQLAVRSFDTVNETSFRIGEYEDLKKAAIDPYVALRDAYYQYRRSKIKE